VAAVASPRGLAWSAAPGRRARLPPGFDWDHIARSTDITARPLRHTEVDVPRARRDAARSRRRELRGHRTSTALPERKTRVRESRVAHEQSGMPSGFASLYALAMRRRDGAGHLALLLVPCFPIGSTRSREVVASRSMLLGACHLLRDPVRAGQSASSDAQPLDAGVRPGAHRLAASSRASTATSTASACTRAVGPMTGGLGEDTRRSRDRLAGAAARGGRRVPVRPGSDPARVVVGPAHLEHARPVVSAGLHRRSGCRRSTSSWPLAGTRAGHRDPLHRRPLAPTSPTCSTCFRR